MNRIGQPLRRIRGVLIPRALGAIAGLLLAAVAQAATVPWTNNQMPECTIGDGTSGTTDKRFNCTDSVAIDATNRKLYATDRENHRVLRFAYPATSDQPTAEAVFGQANFTSGSANRGGAIAANTLNMPYGLAVATNGDLWISDYGNNRIVKIASAYNAASGTAATRVLGQADFVSGTGGIASNRLAHPTGLSVDSSGHLWVADTSNNRVLRFASVASIANGAAAAQVLGQPNFGSNGYLPDTTTPNRLFGPYAVCAAGSVLWVADSQNSRVVRYNNAVTKGPDASADGVLGQPDLTSGTANRGGATADNTLSFPGGVTCDDSGTLFVSDSFNARVLIFANAASLSNGAAAGNWLNNINTAWNLAYDSTYHRLLVPRASSNSIVQYANLTTTATSLTSSNNPSFPGASVSFTATVTGSSSTPTGTVQFTERTTVLGSVNTIVLGSGTLNGSGVATFSTSALAEGSHTIIAKYLGDVTNQCSASPWCMQTVERNTPGITLGSSANGAKQAATVTLTATLAPTAGLTAVPTGSVTFNVDGTDQAPIPLDATGKANWNATGLALGSHIVKATYSGDANYRTLNTSLLQYIDPPEMRSVPIVANSERDTLGATTIIYDGNFSGGAVFTGLYDGYTLWPAFRFNVSAVPTSFIKAELKLHISSKPDDTSTDAFNLHGSNDDAWSDIPVPPETSPTAPATIIATPLASVAANTFTTGDWLTFDVTDFVRTQTTGDEVASFVVTMPSVVLPNWCLGIHSRETPEFAPVLVVLEQLTYSRWATSNFSAAELANSAISGANADPAGTGVTNLLRYACGLPARGPVAAPGTATFNTGTNPTTTTFAFPMCAASADLSYAVQASADLVTWTTAGTYTTTGTARTVAAQVTAPAGAKRFFLRLRVTQVP